MNTNDKNYVDRLHNQQVNELNEIKNRLLILEGKPTVGTNGTIQVELDTDKLYEILFNAYEDCLQQRQERRHAEYLENTKKLRQEYDAKGVPYYASEEEMRVAMVKDFNTFYRLIITYIKRTETKFDNIHSNVLKHLGASTSTNETSKRPSLLSNLPSGFTPKLTEFRHRLAQRIHTHSCPRKTVKIFSILLILLVIDYVFVRGAFQNGLIVVTLGPITKCYLYVSNTLHF